MKLLISALFVLGLAIVAKADNSACLNNKFYMYGDDPELTCKKIRKNELIRQEYCKDAEVHFYCPQACGDCCEDSPTYTFNTPNKKAKDNNAADCEWVGKKPVKRNKWCKEETRRNGEMVKNMCPVACGVCKELVPIVESTFPTSAERTAAITPSPTGFPTSSEPTAVVTDAPTGFPTSPEPTDVPTQFPTSSEPTTFPTSSSPTSACLDDPLFTSSSIKSCKYVRNDEARRQFLCGKYTLVRESCPLACGDCCGDDASFSFFNDFRKEWTCATIAKNPTYRLDWCERQARDIATAKSFRVKSKCAKTCPGMCYTEVSQQPSDNNQDP